MTKKTNNVIRMLEAKKIAFAAFETPSKKISALEVAHFLNISPSIVFKTLVVKRAAPGKPVLAVVSATGEADLKKLAHVLGEKKMILPPMREAEAVTGLQAGGISALALINKGFQVVIDDSAMGIEEIVVSAGQRGLQVRISPLDLVHLTNARFSAISTVS